MLLMIIAGTTGGHIMPAKHVAQAWLDAGGRCIWVGKPEGIEAQIAQQLGIAFEAVDPVNFRALGLSRIRQDAGRLFKWRKDIQALFRTHKPAAVFSTGSYVTIMPGLLAKWNRVPLVIHEQNTVMGFANHMLQYFANQTILGMPIETLDSPVIGNPVKQFPTRSRDTKRLLVIGGSQGCAFFNQYMPLALEDHQDIEVVHIAGKNLTGVSEQYQAKGINARVIAYSDDMADLYLWADMVVARAGAMTLAELAANGLPSLVVPLPSASRNHQMSNARYYALRGAIKLVKQDETGFIKQLRQFVKNDALRAKIAKNITRLNRPDAAKHIVKMIMKEINVNYTEPSHS